MCDSSKKQTNKWAKKFYLIIFAIIFVDFLCGPNCAVEHCCTHLLFTEVPTVQTKNINLQTMQWQHRQQILLLTQCCWQFHLILLLTRCCWQIVNQSMNMQTSVFLYEKMVFCSTKKKVYDITESLLSSNLDDIINRQEISKTTNLQNGTAAISSDHVLCRSSYLFKWFVCLLSSVFIFLSWEKAPWVLRCLTISRHVLRRFSVLRFRL